MDNIYDLKEVDFEEKENTLILWFNSEVVKIKNPSNLIIQPNMIAIGKAESIERENPHYLLKYTLDNGKIRTHCLKGNKTFSTDIKAFAFALL